LGDRGEAVRADFRFFSRRGRPGLTRDRVPRAAGSPLPSVFRMRYNRRMEPVTLKYVESAQGRCGGKPCVVGTRIRVWDIYVWHELQGQSAEEIVHQYPQLSLAAVHAALAYFWDNQTEIRGQMKESEDLAARLQAAAGPGLLDRLRGEDASTDSVSPG